MHVLGTFNHEVQLRKLYFQWSNEGDLDALNSKTIEKQRSQLVGAALFRAGQYARSAELLAHADQIEATSFQEFEARWNFFLAMALYQQGFEQKARKTFEETVSQLEDELKTHSVTEVKYWPLAWYELASIDLVRKEAAALLGIVDVQE
jgi:tetratricopeptide (TPR) repeat protein